MKKKTVVILSSLGIAAVLLCVYVFLHLLFTAIKPCGDLGEICTPGRIVLHFLFFAIAIFSLVVALLVALRKTARDLDRRESMFGVYLSLLSNLETGVLIIDQDRKIRFANQRAAELLRVPPGAVLVDRFYTDFISPLLEPIEDRISGAMARNEEFSREFRVYLNEGVQCVRCGLYGLRGGDDALFYALTIDDKTREDTIRHKLSAQLEETHRYSQAKDNFFANMSHEIRTPINAILGMTYFVKTVVSEPKALEYIHKIESASEILIGVVNDILDFSKMQENKFSLKPENFNLSDVKKILADLFSLKSEQKGLRLEIDFDCPDVFLVYGDQFRITQVFMNLVSNAVKFTDRGFVAVSLNHETVANDVILRCTVRDTGCGLSEDDISRLFTDFEQFGQVLVKNQEGTGLGLAISKRLVEMMHGVIWVDSELGKGSSFHFVIVVKKPEASLARGSSAALPRVVRVTNRVLVVEDNEINGEIAQNLLGEIGLTVDLAEDGFAAIDLCRTNAPDAYDLVLMDIHMPRMNGYDTARVLKKELKLSCPIIAVTATSEPAEVIEANRDVMAGAILKPYNPGIFKMLFGSCTDDIAPPRG